MQRVLGIVGAVWGLAGVFLLIGSACWRLTPIALEAFREYQLSWFAWLFTVGWVIFMVVGEGYRGFQKGFSPRVVSRSRHLLHHPEPLHVLLAPPYCMGLFHARKKRVIVSWCVLLGIVCLILLVRQLPQPWRGIVDLGVVLGLAWGLVAMFVFAAQAYFLGGFEYDPEIPEEAESAAAQVPEVKSGVLEENK